MIAVTVDEEAEQELTIPGSAVGTHSYMSPEQVRGEKLDIRTDLFSSGAVLYEMATGRMAFSGNTPGIIFEAILNRPPISVIHIRPDLPPRLQEIINKAMEKDRDLRYQHASEICADLKRLKRDKGSGRDDSGVRRLENSRLKSAESTSLWSSASGWGRRHYTVVGASCALLLSELLVQSPKFLVWQPSKPTRRSAKATFGRGQDFVSTGKRHTNLALAEKHYAPTDLAEMWGVSVQTIRDLFREEEGVLKIGSDGTRNRRGYKTLRIPESVVERVYDRLSSRC